MQKFKKLLTTFNLSLVGILSCLFVACEMPDLGLPTQGEKTLTATFTQTRVVYADDELDSLRDMLVVTLNVPLQGESVIEDYTLTGELEVGESILTVSYEYSFLGATTPLNDEFTVTVNEVIHEHVFTNYASNNDATCLADGTKTATCDFGVCTQTETIVDEGSMLDHDYTDYIPDGNATCMADGTKTKVCRNGCDYKDTVTDEGSQTDHKFTHYLPDGNATCTENGTKTASCNYGCENKDTIPHENSALGHKFKLSECIRCDETNYLSFTADPIIPDFYYGQSVTISAGVVTDELGVNVTSGTWSIGSTKIDCASEYDAIETSVKVTFTPKSDEYAPVTESVPAYCYTVAFYGGEFYSSIDYALSVANTAGTGTIYVLPLGYQKDVGVAKLAKTIATATEIASGVTLCIPYSEEDLDVVVSSVKATSSTYNSSSFGNTSYLANQIFIAQGHTLTNNGTIDIAGQVSGGYAGLYLKNSNAATSITAGLHGQLNLDANAKLENSGTINCYGFINETAKNNGSEVVLNGGTTTVVFSIVEHHDGSAYIGMINPENSKVRDAAASAALAGMSGVGKFTPDTLQGSPFNRFYIASVTAKTTVNYNANLAGFVDLYTNSTDNVATVNLVNNSDGLVALKKETSYLTSKFDYTTKKMDLDVYGDSKLNPINLKLYVSETKEDVPLLGTITVNIEITLTTGPTGDSDGIYFPISNLFDISLNPVEGSATVDLTGQKIKLLPGSKFTIAEGVTVNAKSIAVYENNSLFTSGIDKSYTNNTPAEFIVNGTLVTDSLGGKVKTNSESASLTINKANSVVSKEIQSFTTGQVVSISVSVASFDLGYTATNYFNDKTSTLTAKGDTATANNATMYAATYYVQNGKWIPSGLSITYDTVGGDTMDALKDLQPGYVIPEDINETLIPTRENYDFKGWYMDANYTTPAAGQTINDFTTIYAKWEKQAGKILVSFETTNVNDISATKTFKTQEITQENLTAKIPEQANNFNTNIEYDRYVVGYYADANYTTEFDFSQTITADTVIYVKWADKVMVIIENGTDSYTASVNGTATTLTTFYVLTTDTLSVTGTKGGGMSKPTVTIKFNNTQIATASGSGFIIYGSATAKAENKVVGDYASDNQLKITIS